jgi:hypothetical protein
VSSDKARRELIFKPYHSIDAGIEEIKELLNSKRITDPNNPRYNNQVWLTLKKGHIL